MNISYQPLWNLLETRKINKRDFLKITNISSSCYKNLVKQKDVNLTEIVKICDALNCDFKEVFSLNKEKQTLNSVVKWVGGKKQIQQTILDFIPNQFNNYIEPFVGGAAILFALQPTNAIINDLNDELINIYNVIKNDPLKLIRLLEKHKKNHSEEYFYQIRNLDRTKQYSKLSDVKKAARVLYLNKTCFNGLYRVNKDGYFNTPFGKYKNPSIVNKENLLNVSKYLNDNNIQILNKDYKEVLKLAQPGDFIYLDPPYMPISESSSFTSYTENGFDIKQQIELKEQCDLLTQKNIKFLLSNSDCQFIRDLYKDYEIYVVKAKRSINSKADKRGHINELLISNYKKEL
ncbi:Dam family site-specific DNA-(adenine-N6)-methyltransferase [Mycoplasma feriruminatoris]|uniref:Site-specific DNA-methyltransferase (adenine-specific) n=1 Tax=Mycoplasma feriruminatoris TaxID=1179777 RepID=A0A654IIC6_9MOLU|nr:Dam family site-specific DNA-(adenine-N6)-methyltransferase [Mycoplasma feriruminatoris]WFQ95152.1 DNA methyltransferase [Mycoplasma feriruminatoris]VZR97718.1 Modification methylase DpnIIA [Mycoplasma feriruminatoris]